MQSCLLKYSNVYFFTKLHTNNEFYGLHLKFIDDLMLIHKRTYDLLTRLSSKAVNGCMYANGFLHISRKIEIFDTVECTKDLSNVDCEEHICDFYLFSYFPYNILSSFN